MYIKNGLIIGFIFLVIGLIALSIRIMFLIQDIPDPNTLASRRVNESTKILDKTGTTVLYDIHGAEKRTIVPWERISESIKKATLASEDAEFYQHKGIDIRGVARAFFKDLISLTLNQGGSTISQQLVKNAILGQERTVTRKIKEAILTLEIERRFSKDQIFWMYLNQIPYGSNIYGVEAASQTFFGISSDNVSNAQAAIFAAMLKAPTYYSPYGNHIDELMSRQKSILKRMRDLGFITENEYDQATVEKLTFIQTSQGIQAPHFVFMVREYLVKKYGEELVNNGGLKVMTTLDLEMQKTAEELVLKYGEINERRYRAKNLSLVAIDPKTGQVLTMVGSRDYFDLDNQGNYNVATALRQPGSAFKPFAYATAIKKGYTDSTIVFDLFTEFNPYCPPNGAGVRDQYGTPCYHPRNYDGAFRGPVTMREALGQSLNVPSVKFLYLAGIDSTIDTATDLGITTLQSRDRFGLSLVLGGAEVRLLDITSAYGVFGNDGIRSAASFILKIEDNNGAVLEEWKNRGTRVVGAQEARMINDILSDNTARAPVFGANNPLRLPDRPVAAKTGTTQENRDGWLIGYTPSLAVGVWTGNNDNKPMTQQGAGVSAAGPLWNEFMQLVLRGKPIEEFIKPDPDESNKIMLNGTITEPPHSILYFTDKDRPHGSYPDNPSSDPQFNNWEYSVRSSYVIQESPAESPVSPPQPTGSATPPSASPTRTPNLPDLNILDE